MNAALNRSPSCVLWEVQDCVSDEVSLGWGRGIWEDYGFGIWVGYYRSAGFWQRTGARMLLLDGMAFEQTKHIFPEYNKEYLYALTH